MASASAGCNALMGESEHAAALSRGLFICV
jgi:hypothetical protein